MEQSYSHILTFWFKHQYFSNELFRSLDLSIAEDSKRLINNLGLIIKPFSGGFYLLASDPELLHPDVNNQAIRFSLFCQDPYYINYTELPAYNLSRSMIYFNNLSTPIESENQNISLHQENYVSGTDIIPICSGDLIIPEYNPDENYRFTDASGNELREEAVTPSTTKPGSFFISGIAPGLVRIFSAGQEILKAYYNPNSIWRKPTCILELFTNEFFEQVQAKKKVEYSINFDNRKTTWKYFLTSKAYLEYTNLSIINKAKIQVFLPPQQQAVTEKITALVFESKTKIPLAEFTDESFQLVDKYESVKRPGYQVIKNLPKASSEQLLTDDSNPSENVYSHIYI